MPKQRATSVRRIGLAAICLSLLLATGAAMPSPVSGADLPAGYWTEEQIKPLLDKTLTLKLDPDLSALGPGERTAVERLIEVGHIMQRLYEISNHHQSQWAKEQLQTLHTEMGQPKVTSDLLDMVRMFKGPILTTLDNRRVAFLPVDDEDAGRNFYPRGITRAEMDAYLDANPQQRDELMYLRAVVRTATADNLAYDLGTLDKHPELDALHPGFRERLESLQPGEAMYAVPYSVAYADALLQAHDLLHAAADAVEPEDWEFARYLRNRARDFLTDDYEAGDAAWITGRFQNLNAQIGSYETYDDKLFSVKSAFSLSLLLRDRKRSDEMAAAVAGIQDIENALPYGATKRVREDLPVGVYNVIADFGQSRGTNTATILPNEPYLARRYGRTILLRYNIMTEPRLFELTKASYDAAVHPDHRDDLLLEGNFYRTLWHEIGHYLGVDRTQDGQTLDEALADMSNTFEEMKADLVSLFSAKLLHDKGLHSDERLRAIYAGGIRRVLQKNKPRLTQPYQTMQLMQWNYFLDNGLLEYDADARALRIHYDRYHDVVSAMLTDVLKIQFGGDRELARSYIERWFKWDDDLHGVIAENMKQTETYRYRLVRYGALGE